MFSNSKQVADSEELLCLNQTVEGANNGMSPSTAAVVLRHLRHFRQDWKKINWSVVANLFSDPGF